MGWACANTYGGQEFRAIENLRRQNFEAFCPTYRKSRRDPTDLPLFPCYVMVRIEENQGWRAINGTYGVIRLLASRGGDLPKPLYVPDEVVDSLRAVVVGDHRLKPNTIVRVRSASSPLLNHVGSVVAMSRDDRVRVLMRLMQRDVVVEFDLGDVEVI